MSITQLSYPTASVAVDGPSGRPREIHALGERRTVTALEAIRDETAAYPPQTGPRRVFVVRSYERRYRLVNLIRDGRWTVEEIPNGKGAYTSAA
jgi:hypothetical protein